MRFARREAPDTSVAFGTRLVRFHRHRDADLGRRDELPDRPTTSEPTHVGPPGVLRGLREQLEVGGEAVVALDRIIVERQRAAFLLD